MQIQCEPTDLYTIAGYQRDGIYVNETWYHGTLFISAAGVRTLPHLLPEAVHANLFVGAQAALAKPDILIVGHHGSVLFLPPIAQASFLTARIGIECMQFEAACRTFNVLLGEGRPVGALLFMEGTHSAI